MNIDTSIDGRGMDYGAEQRKISKTVAELNKIVEEEGQDGEKLKQELSGCQHFLLDTEMENGRHKVFNFYLSTDIYREA